MHQSWFAHNKKGSYLYLLNCRRDLIELEFNDTSFGSFCVISQRKGEEKYSRGDQREGEERKRKMNEREETKEIKSSPLYPYLPQGYQALPNCKPTSVGCPSDSKIPY